MAATVTESAAGADELQREVERLFEGCSHEQVISVCGTLLGQAIANLSDTPEEASAAVDRFAALISDDIRRHWHLVVARRRKG